MLTKQIAENSDCWEVSKDVEQETFDIVVKHLYEQNAPSIFGSSCRYRATNYDNGVVYKCAIGALIPYELYTQWIENVTVSHLVESEEFWVGRENMIKISKHLRTKGSKEFLTSLQELHDFCIPSKFASKRSYRDLLWEHVTIFSEKHNLKLNWPGDKRV